MYLPPLIIAALSLQAWVMYFILFFLGGEWQKIGSSVLV